MTTQKRAAVGGEIGANGEHYEGGKFIATTDRQKGKPKKKAGKPRKVQVEPYKWVVPEEGQRAIYGDLVGTLATWVDRNKPELGIKPYEPYIAYVGKDDWFGYQIAELCEMYNRGERLYMPRPVV